MTTRNVYVTLIQNGSGLEWKFESDGIVANYIDKRTRGDVVYNLQTSGFAFCAPPTIFDNQGNQLSLPENSYTPKTATVKDSHTEWNTSGGVLLHVHNTETLMKFTSPDPDVDNTGDHAPGN